MVSFIRTYELLLLSRLVGGWGVGVETDDLKCGVMHTSGQEARCTIHCMSRGTVNCSRHCLLTVDTIKLCAGPYTTVLLVVKRHG